MNENVITANFRGGHTAMTASLWQYDYGQVLRFAGVSLPDTYEVHFANGSQRGVAKTAIGNANGVRIPDEFLVSGATVYAWIFLHTGTDDGETRYMATIPVRRRAMPSDEAPTPQEQSAITQAIAALTAVADVAASESAAEAAASAERARASATAAAASEASVEADANLASTAATAAESAQAAAETAQTGAETARSGAESARDEAVQAAALVGLAGLNNAAAGQIAQIEATGAAVLESIPADYSELSDDVGNLKSDFDQIENNLSNLQGYIDYISPGANLIDFENLTDGYINGQGGIYDASSAAKEKTSPPIPIDISHTYSFKTEVNVSTGTAWLAVGFWTADGVFLGRVSATVSTVDGVSIGATDIKPQDYFAYTDASYMRVSWRSYALYKNAGVYDIAYKDTTLLYVIGNAISETNKQYHTHGAEIDVSKKGYDIKTLSFAPIEESSKYTQGMAISNGTIFQGYGNGTIELYNFTDGSQINQFDANAGHCGSLSFSEDYPEGNTDYPYLFVSSFIENKTFVYDVTDSTCVLAKTYLIPTDKAGFCQETCVDKLMGTLWCVGHKNNSYVSGGGLVISEWDLNQITDNGDGTLTPTNIRSFEIPWIPYLQAVQILNGQMFIITGDDGGTDDLLTKIWVLDLGNNAIKSLMTDFPDAIRNAEPEGIDFVFDESSYKYYAILATRRSVKYYKIVF